MITPFSLHLYCQSVANFSLPASTQQVKSSSDPDARNASVWTSYDFIRQFCTLGSISETSSGTFCRQNFQAIRSIFQAHPGCSKTIEANPCYTGICSVSALTAEPFKLTKIISSQGAMHVNALTNAQKIFSQLLILRHFQEVNTQANTQRIHAYKPNTLLRHHRKRPVFYSRG